MELTKRRDSYYIEFRVLDECGATTWLVGQGTLSDLAKVRSLATNHVFLYDGVRVHKAFQTAKKDKGIQNFRFTIYGTVRQPT